MKYNFKMKSKITYVFLLISCHFFIACNSKSKKENDVSKNETVLENSSEKVNSLNTLREIWQKLPMKQFPVLEKTNFDTIKIENELSEKEILLLKLNEIYSEFKKEGYNYKFQAAYKLEFSQNFYSIVVHVLKGDNEIETVLINYNLEEKLTDFKVIAYDEIAESMVKTTSRIENNFVTITHEVYLEETKVEISKFHVNTSGEFNLIKGVFTSTIRPYEAILLNKTYTDTIEFFNYNDDGDYKLLIGKKKNKEIVLIYNNDWESAEKYNFNTGDIIKITWKMDSIWLAGDNETLDFKETVLEAKAIKLNVTQKYIVALKNFLIREWKLIQKSNAHIKNINFENNILTIESNEGFDLSSYDFNDVKIIKSDKTKKINITIHNVGGGDGGNVVVSETYILTSLDNVNFNIKRGITKLIQ